MTTGIIRENIPRNYKSLNQWNAEPSTLTKISKNTDGITSPQINGNFQTSTTKTDGKT